MAVLWYASVGAAADVEPTGTDATVPENSLVAIIEETGRELGSSFFTNSSPPAIREGLVERGSLRRRAAPKQPAEKRRKRDSESDYYGVSPSNYSLFPWHADVRHHTLDLKSYGHFQRNYATEIEAAYAVVAFLYATLPRAAADEKANFPDKLDWETMCDADKAKCIVAAEGARKFAEGHKAKPCTCKYTGVSRSDSQPGQWYASTSKHYIGAFNSDFEAACAYDAFVFEFCGDDGPNKADFSKEFDLNTMDEDKMELRKKAKKVGFAKAKAIRAQDQGVAEAREHSDAWSNHAIARSRAGADGPALVRYYARKSVRSVPGYSPGAFDAFVEAFASTIHAAAVQAVDADRACWVALDVDNFRPSVQAAAHQQGLGHVIAHAESVCRRRLATIGLTVGPAFEDSLASFVAGLTAIASEELEI